MIEEITGDWSQPAVVYSVSYDFKFAQIVNKKEKYGAYLGNLCKCVGILVINAHGIKRKTKIIG